MTTPTTLNPYESPDSQVFDNNADTFAKVGLFTTSGRLGRLRYAAYSFGIIALGYLIMGALGAIGSVISEQAGSIAFGIGAVIAVIPMIGMNLNYGCRRLNDMNMSGWMILVLFIPLVGNIFALLMLFMSGTKGINKYGAPPPANSKGVILAGLALPTIVLIGILAAVAIPAYQDYLIRTQTAQFNSQ